MLLKRVDIHHTGVTECGAGRGHYQHKPSGKYRLSNVSVFSYCVRACYLIFVAYDSQFVEIVGMVKDDQTVDQYKFTNFGDDFGLSMTLPMFY